MLVPPAHKERDGALIVPSGRCRRCFFHEAQGIVCKGGRVVAEYVGSTGWSAEGRRIIPRKDGAA
mgnify:FL=1